MRGAQETITIDIGDVLDTQKKIPNMRHVNPDADANNGLVGICGFDTAIQHSTTDL